MGKRAWRTRPLRGWRFVVLDELFDGTREIAREQAFYRKMAGPK